DLHALQLGDDGTGRQHDVLGLEHDRLVPRHLDPPLAQLPGPAVDADPVLLHQVGDAVRVLLDDLLAARLHGSKVQFDLSDHAVVGEPVPGFREVVAGLQKCLGRDATHADAGASERRLLLYQPYVEPELCGADGGDVAAGAGAHAHDAVALAVALRPLSPPAACGPGPPRPP